METFSALLAICAGNSPVTGEFLAQRPVTRSFDVFFDLRLNERLSKQWRGWWFETPLCPLWRHSNDIREMPTLNMKIVVWAILDWTYDKWWVRLPLHLFGLMHNTESCNGNAFRITSSLWGFPLHRSSNSELVNLPFVSLSELLNKESAYRYLGRIDAYVRLM